MGLGAAMHVCFQMFGLMLRFKTLNLSLLSSQQIRMWVHWAASRCDCEQNVLKAEEHCGKSTLNE